MIFELKFERHSQWLCAHATGCESIKTVLEAQHRLATAPAATPPTVLVRV